MKRGEVAQLGAHRLMCGDAGDPDDVARLFEGAAAPELVFTSPPYLQQRAYSEAIPCWDTLMQRVFGAMPHHEKTQVLVNLGLVHRKGEWLPYWDGWSEWMRAQGWRRFGWYIWDKTEAAPGNWNGRLPVSFDFVFHFNKSAIAPNKTQPCKHAGKSTTNTRPHLRFGPHVSSQQIVSSHRIPYGVFSIVPHKGQRTGHNSVFPVALPAAIHAAYSQPGGIVYDPFAGVATSILAAEQGGRVCYGMEISEEYCTAAVERWHKEKSKGAP